MPIVEQLLLNGVKARQDGKGDPWADGHRLLGKKYYMQDVDVQFGLITFGQNTGERLFIESVPDNYSNNEKVVRRFGYVAMFDRKRTIGAAFSESNKVQLANYLYQCQKLGIGQPVECRFFFVIGGNDPPWNHLEIDIHTGERVGTEVSVDRNAAENWWGVWDALGLHWTRQKIREWIDPS